MNDYCVLEEIIEYVSKYDYELYSKVIFIGTLEQCLEYEDKLEDTKNDNTRYYTVSCMSYKKECNEFLKNS